MKKRFLLVLSLLIVFTILLGCESRSNAPAGLREPVDGLPSIETFSGTKLEDYTYQFVAVERAVYSHDGTEEEISSGDQRLLRLLNFIAYSENNSFSWWRQGYIQDAEINRKYGNSPRLIVYFQSNRNTQKPLQDSYKIVVSRSAVLFYRDDSYIEECWPYLDLYHQLVVTGSITGAQFNAEISEGQEGEPWLDLLGFSGF